MDVSGLIGRRVAMLLADKTVRGVGRVVGGYVAGDRPQLIIESGDGKLVDLGYWSLWSVRMLPTSEEPKRECGKCNEKAEGYDLTRMWLRGVLMEICGACRIGLTP